ncbi:tetratricopeptide repeat protein [Myroides injenensis]|uniref:tetratricopeptide repeat protein n=1 Tax=Myroides injenensis TaxID=1183151 RepID=UPI000288B803|nr:tetratricopeptide repeat protein [Myroides injenensis]
MKNIFYLIVFFCSSIVFAQQTSTWEKDFDKANTLYQNENFSEAIAVYQKLSKEKSNSPELYFNLANAYYKTKDNVNAVYNYEKALKLDPKNKSFETNLNYARKNLKDDITIIQQYNKEDIIHQCLKILTTDQWAIVATLSAILVFIFFAIYYINQNNAIKKSSFALVVLFVLVTIGTIYIATFEDKYTDTIPTGIVFSLKTDIKDEPKSTAKTLLSIHEGAKVYILETKSLWIRVRLDNQEEGWIEKKNIKEI